MKRNKLIFILLLLLFVFTLAMGQRGRITGSLRKVILINWMAWKTPSTYMHQKAGYHIMSDSTDTNYGWGIADTLGRAVKCRFLRNTSGGAVARGDVLGRCLESDNTNGRIAIWLGGN